MRRRKIGLSETNKAAMYKGQKAHPAVLKFMQHWRDELTTETAQEIIDKLRIDPNDPNLLQYIKEKLLFHAQRVQA